VRYSRDLEPLHSQIVMKSVIKTICPMTHISENAIFVASDDGECKLLDWNGHAWMEVSNELAIGVDRVVVADAVSSAACVVTKDHHLGIVDVHEKPCTEIQYQLIVRKLDENNHGIATWMDEGGKRLLTVNGFKSRLLSPDLDLIHEVELVPPKESSRRDPLCFAVCATSNPDQPNGHTKRGRVAVAFEEQVVRVFEYNESSNKIRIASEFILEGGGHIRSIRFDGHDSLWVDTGKRKLERYTWDADGRALCIGELTLPLSYTHLLAMYDGGLFAGDESSLFHMNTRTNESVSRSFHELTCCGIDFDSQGQHIVAGDFVGNLILWDKIKNCPAQQTKVPNTAVRSIQWKTGTSRIYAGCMDGSVFLWDHQSLQNPKRVLSCRGGIAALQWEHGEDPHRLAAGTTDGQLVIAEEVQNDDGSSFFKINVAIHAHRPFRLGQTDQRFGSIQQYAEVWSVAWSPCNNFIATASEDQSIVIWDAHNGDKIHLFSGHATAVTSIDWRSYEEGEFLVSTADDNRVMVWKRNSPQEDKKNQWTLFEQFNVSSTITCSYLKLRRKSPMIIVVSTNGLLSLFDIVGKRLIYRKKVHSGSIEGLQWNGNTDEIATVSSDCSINLMQYNEEGEQEHQF